MPRSFPGAVACLVFVVLLCGSVRASPIPPVSSSFDNLQNSTDTEVVIVYPISGYYAPLQRGLYWAIILFTILGLGNVWLVTAAFGTAMTYSSVAAVHAIAMYAVNSREYYDADALVIWEILFCTSVLLPSWLAHYRSLRSTTAQIVLRLWGALMFVGGVVVICQLVKVNGAVLLQQNDCLSALPLDAGGSFDMVDWRSSPDVLAACPGWEPYAAARQPMRELNEVVIVRSSHGLAAWMDRIRILAVCAGCLSIGFIVMGFLMPDSASLDRHRRAQLQKLRRHKRAKGNHPADTPQMPIAWCFGIVTLVFAEVAIALVPVSEGPRAVGQWGPWVAAVLVLGAVLVNHYLEAPTAQMWKRLGDALGPLVWYQLAWMGNAPSPQARREAEETREEELVAELREQLERQRRRTTTTQGVQTDDVPGVDDPTIETPPPDRKRRFSESDIGLQTLSPL